MDNVYTVADGNGMCCCLKGDPHPVILIKRKPSQIPIHIDMEIMHLGGVMCNMDGPNNKVSYHFFLQDRFPKAVAYLKKYSWKEEE